MHVLEAEKELWAESMPLGTASRWSWKERQPTGLNWAESMPLHLKAAKRLSANKAHVWTIPKGTGENQWEGSIFAYIVKYWKQIETVVCKKSNLRH